MHRPPCKSDDTFSDYVSPEISSVNSTACTSMSKIEYLIGANENEIRDDMEGRQCDGQENDDDMEGRQCDGQENDDDMADLFDVMNGEVMHSHSASDNDCVCDEDDDDEEHDEIVFIASEEVSFQAESVEEAMNACDLHRELMPEMVNEEENNAFTESVSDNGNEAESE